MTPRRLLRKYAQLALTSTILAASLPLATLMLAPLDIAVQAENKATTDPSKGAIKAGEASMYKRDYDTAVDQFKQAIYFARNHYNPLAWKYLGMAYKAQREYPKAVEAFLTHLKQVTEPAVAARCDLASCYVEMGEYDKARKELLKANVESSGITDALIPVAYAKMEERMGDLDRAWGHFDVAARLDRNLTDALMGRARIETKLGIKYFPNQTKYLNDALKHYMEIVDNRHRILGADWEEVYYNMAQIYFKRGDHQNAIDHLHYQMRETPNSYLCHLALGRIFDDEKHYASAIKQYELAIPNAPRGTSVEPLKTRILYLQQKAGGVEDTPVVVKPSPLMRQQAGQIQQPRAQKSPSAAPGESGF